MGLTDLGVYNSTYSASALISGAADLSSGLGIGVML